MGQSRATLTHHQQQQQQAAQTPHLLLLLLLLVVVSLVVGQLSKPSREVPLPSLQQQQQQVHTSWVLSAEPR
jgi:hypothetical protein